MIDNPKSLRQIIYNKRIHSGEQEELPHEWTFVILNQSQEIDRIENRIYEELRRSGPCGDGIASEGLISHNFKEAVQEEHLHARYLNFRSQAGRVRDPINIYNSKKFRKDRNLKLFSDIEFDNYITTFQKRNHIYVPRD